VRKLCAVEDQAGHPSVKGITSELGGMGCGEPLDHPSCSQNAHGETDRQGAPMLALCSQNRGVMEPDDLLCSRNARSEKVRRKGVRSFLCSRARALGREWGSRQTILLARRAPTMKRWSLDARSEGQPGDSPW
jgi:hypothetical protein